MEQQVLSDYNQLDRYLMESGVRRLLLVCGKSIERLEIGTHFQTLEAQIGVQVVRFGDFTPNPTYESVVKGVELFRRARCDAVAAVGGGSAIDVAKCIKLFCGMDAGQNYLGQKIVPNNVKLLAVPTTAGSGSEATRFAVIYHGGEKQSIADLSAIPSAVLLDASALETLPAYQRKSTMLDALCHAIESCWSIHATPESRAYSRQAIQLILPNVDLYLRNDASGNKNMLTAANLAGKAINLTETTAGHAMSYKLTGLYGVAHGHAVALCVARLWPYMIRNCDQCTVPGGQVQLKTAFQQIAQAMGCETVSDATKKFDALLEYLELSRPVPNERDYEILNVSVNRVRLKNNPVQLDAAAINLLYHQILAPQ